MNIIGRLTRDAEVRNLPNQKQVVNFSVAINENYRNKQGEWIEQTTFFDCAFWLSTKVAELLTKGALVELDGRVFTRAWLGKDGQPRAGLNFLTSRIKIHSNIKRKSSSELKTSTTDTKVVEKPVNEEADDDLPF